MAEYHVRRPSGNVAKITADEAIFSGGAAVFWAEDVRLPPRRKLVKAFAPGQWTTVEPAGNSDGSRVR